MTSDVRLHPDAKELSRVFAIRDDASGYWWECNMEHGAGWCDQIKQAWRRREALKEIADIVQRHGMSVDGLSLVRLTPDG
jgi:hypothetical protein